MIVKDTATGKEHRVLVLGVKKPELKKVRKKDGWNFDWNLEGKYEVYKVVFESDETALLGLISHISYGPYRHELLY